MFLSGIDIGGTSIKFGIFDEQLNLLQQWSRPTPKEPYGKPPGKTGRRSEERRVGKECRL